VVLVQRNSLNPFSAGVGALRELTRRGLRYLGAYWLLGLVSVAVVALWWTFASALPATGPGLWLTFLAQQLFVAVRIGLRLAHLGTTFELSGGST
jgi:hypothetical protein